MHRIPGESTTGVSASHSLAENAKGSHGKDATQPRHVGITSTGGLLHVSQQTTRQRSPTCTLCGQRVASRAETVMWGYHSSPDQQRYGAARRFRSRWTGGHGTEPYEQNTQQWPARGRSSCPQALQVYRMRHESVDMCSSCSWPQVGQWIMDALVTVAMGCSSSHCVPGPYTSTIHLRDTPGTCQRQQPLLRPTNGQQVAVSAERYDWHHEHRRRREHRT
jgi:hypothetical protein